MKSKTDLSEKEIIHLGIEFSKTLKTDNEAYLSGAGFGYSCGYQAAMQHPVPANKYPIGGYAPGNYMCNCTTCKAEFFGDKLAVQCEPCAVKMLHPVPDEAGEELHSEITNYIMEVCRQSSTNSKITATQILSIIRRFTHAPPSGEDAGKGWISVHQRANNTSS